MSKPKKERNKEIVRLKNRGKSFRYIASHFNVNVKTAFEIYEREANKVVGGRV